MLDKIFKRWNIGDSGERISFLHCAEAAKIKRALRLVLPADGTLNVTAFTAGQIIRLGNVQYDAGYATCVTRLQPDLYGGAAAQIDVARLRECLA